MSRHWLGLLLLSVWIGVGGVAHAAITPSDDPLAFGNVVVGTTPSPTLDDTLTADATTMNVTVALRTGGTCGDFSIVSPIGPFTINQGPTGRAVTVAFTPSVRGSESCVVDIKVNGVVSHSFNVTGMGEAPGITVDKFPSFTPTESNKSSTAQLKLTNSGSSLLHITGATLGPSSVFSVSGVPTTPLAVGTQATIDITCAPTVFGDFSDTLAIASDALNDSPHNISLSCTGTQGVLALDQTTTVDFGTVPHGGTQTRTFKVSNITLAVTANLGYSLDITTIAKLSPGPANAVTVTASFKPMSKTDGGTAMITVTGGWGVTPTLTHVTQTGIT